MTRLYRDIRRHLGQSHLQAKRTIELMAKYPPFKAATFKILKATAQAKESD